MSERFGDNREKNDNYFNSFLENYAKKSAEGLTGKFVVAKKRAEEITKKGYFFDRDWPKDWSLMTNLKDYSDNPSLFKDVMDLSFSQEEQYEDFIKNMKSSFQLSEEQIVLLKGDEQIKAKILNLFSSKGVSKDDYKIILGDIYFEFQKHEELKNLNNKDLEIFMHDLYKYNALIGIVNGIFNIDENLTPLQKEKYKELQSNILQQLQYVEASDLMMEDYIIILDQAIADYKIVNGSDELVVAWEQYMEVTAFIDERMTELELEEENEEKPEENNVFDLYLPVSAEETNSFISETIETEIEDAGYKIDYSGDGDSAYVMSPQGHRFKLLVERKNGESDLLVSFEGQNIADLKMGPFSDKKDFLFALHMGNTLAQTMHQLRYNVIDDSMDVNGVNYNDLIVISVAITGKTDKSLTKVDLRVLRNFTIALLKEGDMTVPKRIELLKKKITDPKFLGRIKRDLQEGDKISDFDKMFNINGDIEADSK